MKSASFLVGMLVLLFDPCFAAEIEFLDQSQVVANDGYIEFAVPVPEHPVLESYLMASYASTVQLPIHVSYSVGGEQGLLDYSVLPHGTLSVNSDISWAVAQAQSLGENVVVVRVTYEADELLERVNVIQHDGRFAEVRFYPFPDGTEKSQRVRGRLVGSPYARSDLELPSRLIDHVSLFPNPFNPSLGITFSCRVPGRVCVRVYDLRGRVVKHIADREFSTGEHDLTWDGRAENGRRAPSGAYFVRFGTGDEVVVRKVALTK